MRKMEMHHSRIAAQEAIEANYMENVLNAERIKLENFKGAR